MLEASGTRLLTVSRPTEDQLRRGEQASRGDRTNAPRTRQAKLHKWAPYRNPVRTMLGFVSIELASWMIVNDLKLMIGPKGARWIAMPAKQRDRGDGSGSGKAVWDDYLEFTNKAVRDRFQDVVLKVIRRAHPELFDGEPGR